MSPRRTRRGTIIPDINYPSTEKKGRKAATSPKEKSRPPPKKRNTRATKLKVTSDSEDNQLRKVSKKSSRKRPAKSEADSLITEDESITCSPKGDRSSTRLENSLITDDESTPRHRPASRASVARIDTTPKSSPISVPLTPHRTTKTPRRSPVNFGSPKTHSETPLRLSKTPRKLEIDETPPSSEDLQPAKKNEERAGSKSPSSRSNPKSPSLKKTPKRAVAKKSTKRAAAQSRKSPSPKKEAKDKNSPKMNQTVSSVSKKLVSPRSSRRSTPASKVKKSPVKLRRSSVKRGSSSVAKNPVVMIEKMEDSEKFKKSTPVKTSPPSPKRPKSVVKPRQPITDSGTPLRPVPTPKNPRSVLKKIILEKQAKIASPYELKVLKDSSGFIASTPREKIRRSLNLSDSLNDSPPLSKKKLSPIVRKKSPSPIKMKSPSPVKKKSPSPTKKSVSPLGRNKSLSSRIEGSFLGINDESEPAMSDTSLINLSDVFDSDVSQKEEGKKSKDSTYELLEPKTPTLQAKKSKKRTSADANLSGSETEVKKVCKVRFADSDVVTDSSVAKLRSGTPGHKLSLKRTSEMRSKSRSPQRLSKGLSNSTRRRSSSVSVIEGTPRTPNNKRRINSVATSNLKSDNKAQLASVNRLSRPRMSVASEKKPDAKTPVPRRIPNFAEIHKKNFNKMESIVDAKKRVAERHVAMVNPVVISATKSMPEVVLGKQLELSKPSSTSESANGAYNRFGFKVRRNEAVQSIAKKQATMTSEKKKKARREILKGVRTNRRFELQMKSRKSLGTQ